MTEEAIEIAKANKLAAIASLAHVAEVATALASKLALAPVESIEDPEWFWDTAAGINYPAGDFISQAESISDDMEPDKD